MDVKVVATHYGRGVELIDDVQANVLGIRYDINHEVSTSDHRKSSYAGVTNVDVVRFRPASGAGALPIV